MTRSIFPFPQGRDEIAEPSAHRTPSETSAGLILPINRMVNVPGRTAVCNEKFLITGARRYHNDSRLVAAEARRHGKPSRSAQKPASPGQSCSFQIVAAYRHLSRMRAAMSSGGPLWLVMPRDDSAGAGQAVRSNNGRSVSGMKRVLDA
jgi:hypothetical protein